MINNLFRNRIVLKIYNNFYTENLVKNKKLIYHIIY